MIDPAIHITRWGQSGPTVVMVHGSAQGSQVGGDGHFPTQEKLAAMGYQVVVPDRPGHGRSPDPGRPDDAEADGAWVAELLGNGAHLVGHSFGGAVALAAAALRPQAVWSLTLIEPAMMPVAIDSPVVMEFVKRLMAAGATASSPAEAVKNFAKVVHIPDEIRGGKDEAELTRMGRGLQELKLPTPPQLRGWLATVAAAGVPVQVIDGGWNPAFGVIADRVAELSGGRHIVIQSPHHFPQAVSDEFNGTLATFMAMHGPR